MDLADLLPTSEYRFQMRFERRQVADYFAVTPQHEKLTAERCHWLRSAPHTYAALLPEALPLLEETVELAVASSRSPLKLPPSTASRDAAWETLLALGEWWEPDFLLLKADARNDIRLCGGCVCFPSSWSLAEKVGHPLPFIHEAVPGLNDQIGNQIHTFLSKLKPGIAWQRTNWGLSRSAELNQHPDRHLARLDATVGLKEIWFRVEHQALIALPRTGGILFAIRIAMHPLSEVKENAIARSRLISAIKSMPEAMAIYKGLASARTALLHCLTA